MEEVAHCALLHTSLSGQIQTQHEGLKVLSQHGAKVRFGGNSEDWRPGRIMLFGENDFHFDGQSPFWIERAEAALKLSPATGSIYNDPRKRSPLMLLQHLAYDGNRLVRWAAQTRLADPNFKFTWQDDE